VPYVVDGNNLLHALAAVGADVGRGGLCGLLEPLAKAERVEVVFDGHSPREGVARPIARGAVRVTFSGGRSADDVVLERVDNATAPRRLTVVSTDREIRRGARRRRCRGVTSEQFARQLLAGASQGREPPKPAEPTEKRQGISGKDTDYWLREFGLDGAGGGDEPPC